MEGLNVGSKDEGGVCCGSPREGPTLKGMDEGGYRCLGCEAGTCHSLKDLRERPKKDDNPVGGG